MLKLSAIVSPSLEDCEGLVDRQRVGADYSVDLRSQATEIIEHVIERLPAIDRDQGLEQRSRPTGM
jgi:hypothetical protein